MASNPKAEACLVATAVHLSLMVVADPNLRMWIGILEEILPDCEGCPDELVPVRETAAALVGARTTTKRDNALVWLRDETRRYYQRAAAYRHEAWRLAKGGRG